MNVLVISTPNTVYATYEQTICHKEQYSNSETFENALTNAKASAFGYACTGSVSRCGTVVFAKIVTDDDIFNYLKTI